MALNNEEPELDLDDDLTTTLMHRVFQRSTQFVSAYVDAVLPDDEGDDLQQEARKDEAIIRLASLMEATREMEPLMHREPKG